MKNNEKCYIIGYNNMFTHPYLALQITKTATWNLIIFYFYNYIRVNFYTYMYINVYYMCITIYI